MVVLSYSLGFSIVHDYSSRLPGILVPVVLKAASRRAAVFASLDTGASHCLFARVYAEGLGLPFESGQRLTFATANSRFDAYGHELTIDVLGIEITALVFFFADPNITKNVLGRQGWLDRVRLGLVDYDRRLYIAGYDEGL
jgi:hypothetical protein